MYKNPPYSPTSIVFYRREDVKCEFQIEKRAALMMRLLVHMASPDEVTWLGRVQRYKDGDTDLFILEDIYIPKQTVTGTTILIEAEAEAEIVEELIEKGDYESISLMKVWGHSHPSFSVSPSGTDEDQTSKFLNKVSKFFVRIIVNNDCDMNVAIYLLDEGKVIHHPGIYLTGEDLTDEEVIECVNYVHDMLKTRVKKHIYTFPKIWGDNDFTYPKLKKKKGKKK